MFIHSSRDASVFMSDEVSWYVGYMVVGDRGIVCLSYAHSGCNSKPAQLLLYCSISSGMCLLLSMDCGCALALVNRYGYGSSRCVRIVCLAS